MISIRSRQDYEGMESDSVELTTTGALTPTEGGYQLSYQESELTGMEGTLTSFLISPDRVVLTRTGELNSQMVFERGVRHLSLYSTPMGSMEVGVATRVMRSTIGEDGGELEVDYAIDINHQMAGQNFFSLTVREARISQ
jgi:uncharacterized beta-barrel protein YwiB (DUF1934 family)